ncbi:Uncharacterised protein [Mycobacterium tuberculosis]|nr:Uncharacterised protein [Mycobacterium tuberculosis]
MRADMSVTSMLDREVYVYAEVDKLIGLPAGTAKRWINGYERGGPADPPRHAGSYAVGYVGRVRRDSHAC